MAQQRETQKRNRTKTMPSRKRKAKPDAASAQIISFVSHRSRPGAIQKDPRRLSKAPASGIDRLIGVLSTEVTIAIGISRGLTETLIRFQDYLVAVDKEIADGDVAQVQAIALKQIAHLRATVLAASADLRRVMPDACSHMIDATPIDRSDIVYS